MDPSMRALRLGPLSTDMAILAHAQALARGPFKRTLKTIKELPEPTVESAGLERTLQQIREAPETDDYSR